MHTTTPRPVSVEERNALVESVYPLAWRIAGRRATSLGIEIEDLAQDIILNALLHASRGGYEPDRGRPSTWLYVRATSAVHRLVQFASAERRKPPGGRKPVAELSLLADTRARDPAEPLESEEGREEVLKLLDPLRESDREVVARRFGLGGHQLHTLDQLAELYGITRQAARGRLENAMARLRKAHAKPREDEGESRRRPHS